MFILCTYFSSFSPSIRLFFIHLNILAHPIYLLYYTLYSSSSRAATTWSIVFGECYCSLRFIPLLDGNPSISPSGLCTTPLYYYWTASKTLYVRENTPKKGYFCSKSHLCTTVIPPPYIPTPPLAHFPGWGGFKRSRRLGEKRQSCPGLNVVKNDPLGWGISLVYPPLDPPYPTLFTPILGTKIGVKTAPFLIDFW